jgi:hypothetical protein
MCASGTAWPMVHGGASHTLPAVQSCPGCSVHSRNRITAARALERTADAPILSQGRLAARPVACRHGENTCSATAITEHVVKCDSLSLLELRWLRTPTHERIVPLCVGWPFCSWGSARWAALVVATCAQPPRRPARSLATRVNSRPANWARASHWTPARRAAIVLSVSPSIDVGSRRRRRRG